MTVIDTHQHRWDLGKFDYRWIQPGSVLARNYLTDAALRAMQSGGVDSCVLVEAGTNRAEEMHWFLDMAHQDPHIVGVVGYIDLKSDVLAALEAIQPEHRRHLKGVRIGLMDPALDLATLAPGLNVLAHQRLTCDLLIRRGGLSQVYALAAAHPDVTFVLDHFAGARIHADDHADWRTQLEPVAALPNTVMKVSGCLTAADPMPPTVETLRPFFETALDLYGSSRLMYGSDWPVCLRGGSYESGVHSLQTLAGALTPDEQADLWGRTATKTYQL